MSTFYFISVNTSDPMLLALFVCLQSDDIITCIISGTEVKKVTQILHIYYVTIVTIRSITEIDVGVTVILQVQTSSIVLSATIVTLVITVSRLI